MNRQTRPSQLTGTAEAFGAVLETLESVAEANRTKAQADWLARQQAALDAGAPLFEKSIEEMLAHARSKPRLKARLRARPPLDDLDADYNRGGQYPEGKW